MSDLQPIPTVLVVEDDADVRARLQSLLLAAGFRVVCAESGARALQLAVSNRPEAVLLDVRLPDVDGVDLAIQLTDLRFMRTVPLLFLTGNIDSHVIEAARWMNHATLLKKPFNGEIVVKALRTALGSRGRAFRRHTLDTQPPEYELPEIEIDNALAAQGLRNRQQSRQPESFHRSGGGSTKDARVELSLSDLIDDISHDARSTLFVVSEFANQTACGLDGPEHSERRRMLEVIEDRTAELKTLFDLLSLGRRVEVFDVRHVRQPVAIREWLEPMIAVCSQLVRRKSCSFEASIDQDDLGIDVDPERAKTAVLSLFLHVVSMAESSSTIHLDISRAMQGDTAAVEVTIRASTLSERPKATAIVADGDNLRDACRVDQNPKCALAAAIMQRLGGGISLDWQQREFTATVLVPIVNDTRDPSLVETVSHVATYSGD